MLSVCVLANLMSRRWGTISGDEERPMREAPLIKRWAETKECFSVMIACICSLIDRKALFIIKF